VDVTKFEQEPRDFGGPEGTGRRNRAATTHWNHDTSPAPRYLDWNSTTPPLPEVTAAVARVLAENWGNSSSPHRVGRAARRWIEDARERLAVLLGVMARDVIFTSGATEANNWALLAEGPLLVSRLEHPSVTSFAEAAARRGRLVRWLEVEPSGVLALADLERALSEVPSGALVALMAVNHETGVVQPLAEAARLVHRHGSRLHVDAVQWLGKAPLDILEVADSVAVAGHKIRGPKGVGALCFRGLAPERLLQGGAQERGLRPGTQDAAVIAGFGVALAHVELSASRQPPLRALRDRLETALRDVASVNGTAPRLGHVSNLSFSALPGPELVAALDLAGICVASGSACSAGTTEPSTVIGAMVGLERARGAVRFSLGETSTDEDVEVTVREVLRLLSRA
jgi:cysteine desulfurase